MYSKGIEKWQKRPPQDRRKWAEFSDHMIKDYYQQLNKTGGTTMGQEGYGTAMHGAGYLTDRDSLTEGVKKYAERSTQAEERMAHMEAKPPPFPCYQQLYPQGAHEERKTGNQNYKRENQYNIRIS